MNNKLKYTVTVCTDYIIRDQEEIQKILERVSRIVSNSYKRVQQEG